MHLPSPDSVAGGITAFFTLMGAVIGGAMKVAQVLRKRDERRMASIPPSQVAPALERRLDTLERVVSEQARWREEELIARVGELEKSLFELGQDQGRMAHALATERQRAIRAESKLAVELEQRRLLENALAEATYAREKAERERDAARRAAEAARKA